jgi:hypothetical protein
LPPALLAVPLELGLGVATAEQSTAVALVAHLMLSTRKVDPQHWNASGAGGGEGVAAKAESEPPCDCVPFELAPAAELFCVEF